MIFFSSARPIIITTYLSFLVLTMIRGMTSYLLPGHWYPILTTAELYQKRIHRVRIDNKPFVLYASHNSTWCMHTDICPHQRASFSKGWINVNGNIHCPYHGFEFQKGTFCQIPNGKPHSSHSSKSRKRNRVDSLGTWPIRVQDGVVYALSPFPLSSGVEKESTATTKDTTKQEDENKETTSPSFPVLFTPFLWSSRLSECFDPSFRTVSGNLVLHQNHHVVTENVLDMLHISYIHRFGNRLSPLPSSLSFESLLNKTGGRSTFWYYPHPVTLSTQVGKVNRVKVENEYYLPSTTVTRVAAGPMIKTVVTECVPISPLKCRLFWKVHRNFWVFPPYLEGLNWVMDQVMIFFMKSTLEEDKTILSHVYPPESSILPSEKERIDREVTNHDESPNDSSQQSGEDVLILPHSVLSTKYDITIREFRRTVSNVLQRLSFVE